ncbi:MAG: cytochrome c1 [Wenzhouxiangella sp.]
MNFRYLLCASVLASGAVLAAGGGDLEHADTNVHDRAALQRGAAMFTEYCMGCHSAQYQRYKRLAEDLDLGESLVEEYLVPPNAEIGDYMLTAMDAEQAEEWFGIAPPDLTLTARSRGSDWVYSFLKSFYMSDSGWNNLVLDNASMPHVLWELQGIQRPIIETETTDEGETRSRVVGLELDEPGRMSPEEYDQAILDLVSFMEYLAEPAVLERERVGIWVILFLAVFTLLAFLLYKEFWKDVK